TRAESTPVALQQSVAVRTSNTPSAATSKDSRSVKNLRLLLAVTTAGAVLITTAVGLLLGPVWATVVGTVGVLATVVLSAYVLIKSNQATLQRLSGAQKQNERMLKSLWSLQQKAEGQRWAMAQQTAQLGSILNLLSEPDEHPQALTDLRRQVEQVLSVLEAQRTETQLWQRSDVGRELDALFADDPDIEITTDAGEGENR